MVRFAVSFRRSALIALGLGWLLCTNMVHARSGPEALDRPAIALTALPPEGQQTYRLIQQGGPFPHEKDGSAFGNRERQLPVSLIHI